MSSDKSTKKVIGFRMDPKLIDFIEKIAKKFSKNKIDIAEAVFDNFKSLPESEQKKIISAYLTKNL